MLVLLGGEVLGRTINLIDNCRVIKFDKNIWEYEVICSIKVASYHPLARSRRQVVLGVEGAARRFPSTTSSPTAINIDGRARPLTTFLPTVINIDGRARPL